MPFPFSLAGTVTADGLTAAQAIDRLAVAVAAKEPSAIERGEASLEFRAGPFRLVSGWNILGPISAGGLRAYPTASGVTVRYRARFDGLLAVVTLGVGLFFGPVVLTEPGGSVQRGVGALLVAWLWLFGGNYLAFGWRWRRFLRQALAEPAGSAPPAREA